MPKPEGATIRIEELSITKILKVMTAPFFNESAAMAEMRAVFRMADLDNQTHLHQLLDIIFELRELARGDSNSAPATLAHEAAAILLRGAMGWARERPPLYAKDVQSLHSEPGKWRQELWEQLERGTDLMPDWLVGPLILALQTLNYGAGITPELLRPAPKKGHGLHPGMAQTLERVMVRWGFYRAGAGAPAGQALQEVAEAAGVSVDAVEKWQREWRKIDPVMFEREKLICRERGANGQPFREDDHTLQTAVQQWKLARQPAKARTRAYQKHVNK